jgi:hypothetical protein
MRRTLAPPPTIPFSWGNGYIIDEGVRRLDPRTVRIHLPTEEWVTLEEFAQTPNSPLMEFYPHLATHGRTTTEVFQHIFAQQTLWYMRQYHGIPTGSPFLIDPHASYPPIPPS